MKNNYQAFLNLIRAGIGCPVSYFPQEIDWQAIESLSAQHGVSAIIVDGIETLTENQKPPKFVLLQWIGEILQDESTYSLQKQIAKDVASLFYKNSIKTYVLKGLVVSECYPKPNHRVSADIDCYLLPEIGDFDAWSLGNDLIRAKGFHVNTDFYKNSSFDVSGVNIENHKFITPFRGNKQLADLERILQSLIKSDKGTDHFEGAMLYRPPVMASALFLVEHAYSHFLHEGLTWRHVLDWMMFSRKHHTEIDWTGLMANVDEFGFRKFYDSYERLGRYLLGEIREEELTDKDKLMLADVWAPLDLHESDHGMKGKFALAGNTWMARWKYKHFAEISMVHALWIQVKGVLFIKNPTLE